MTTQTEATEPTKVDTLNAGTAPGSSNPLDQLRDIHLPPEPDAWPMAPGWWATLITLAIVGLIGRKLWQTWQLRQRDKRFVAEARTTLADIKQRFEAGTSPEGLASELSVLVKRVFLSLYPRHYVAGMYGDEWLAMLSRTTSNPAFGKELKVVFDEAPYRAHVSDSEFATRFAQALEATDRWLLVSTRKPGEEG